MKNATHLLVAKAYPFYSDILSLKRRKLDAIPLLSSCHTAFKSEGNNFSKAKTKTFVEKSHSLLPSHRRGKKRSSWREPSSYVGLIWRI